MYFHRPKVPITALEVLCVNDSLLLKDEITDDGFLISTESYNSVTERLFVFVCFNAVYAIEVGQRGTIHRQVHVEDVLAEASAQNHQTFQR